MATLHRTFLNWKETGPDTEKNSGISQTQPDMTLSLQELLERHVRGLDVPTFEGSFQDEGDSYRPSEGELDLAEVHTMRQQNAERIKDLEETLKQSKSKKSTKPSKQQVDEGDAPSGEADRQQKSDSPE